MEYFTDRIPALEPPTLDGVTFPTDCDLPRVSTVNSDEMDLLRSFSLSVPRDLHFFPSTSFDSFDSLNNHNPNTDTHLMPVAMESCLINPIKRKILFEWPFEDQNVAGSGPEVNLDVSLLQQRRTKQVPRFAKQLKWSLKERELLGRAIKLQNLRLLYERILQDFPNLKHKLALESTEGPLEIDSEARRFIRKIDELKRLSDQQLQLNVEYIDWDVVSQQFLPHRSPIDCKLRWLNYEHPSIDSGSWTKPDLAALYKMAELHGFCNWRGIAERFGRGRTAFDCFVEFQRKFGQYPNDKEWSELHDLVLDTGIKLLGERHISFISNCLEGFTQQQCLSRWQRHLNQNIKRGKWTAEEDAALMNAVQLFGKQSWYKIRQFVPGRTDIQCRERYCNVLDPDLTKGPWSAAEDDELVRAVQENGVGKWSLISRYVPGRTDSQCKRRWTKLQYVVRHPVDLPCESPAKRFAE